MKKITLFFIALLLATVIKAQSKKISELTPATALTGTELLPIVQSGVNKTTTTSSFQFNDPDLTAISTLSTTGFLKRTGTSTWSLDNGTFLTGSSLTSPIMPYASSSTAFSNSNLYHGTNGLKFGAAPSGGTSTYWSFEHGNGLSITSNKTLYDAYIGSNVYYNGSFRNATNNAGNLISLSSDGVRISTFTAASAGTAITQSEKFSLLTSGYLGIGGETSPPMPLSIKVNSGTEPVAINFNRAGSYTWRVGVDNNAGDLGGAASDYVIRDQSQSAARFIIKATSGKVLLGTTPTNSQSVLTFLSRDASASGEVKTFTTSTYAATLLDDADAAATRTTLGVTPGGATNELQKNNGATAFTGTKVFSSSNGDLSFGDTGLAGDRTITTTGSAAEVDLVFSNKSTALGTTSERMRLTSMGDLRFLDNTTISASTANLTLSSIILGLVANYISVPRSASVPGSNPINGAYLYSSLADILSWRDVAGEIYDLRTQSGTYTPTLSNISNVSASAAYVCQWMRVGATVTVSGRLAIDPISTGTDTHLGISLPIASSFGNNEECGGTASCPSVSNYAVPITANTSTDTAQLWFLSTDTSNKDMYFSFTYQIVVP